MTSTADRNGQRIHDAIIKKAKEFQHYKLPAWLEVPWPDWMPWKEPDYVRHLPGGSISAGIILLVALCVVLLLLKALGWILFKCCRKELPAAHALKRAKEPLLLSNDVDEADMARVECGPITVEEALKDCVGPKLCVILPPFYECRCGCCARRECCLPCCRKGRILIELESWFTQSAEVKCARLLPPKGSELAHYRVWVIGITEANLYRCAEAQRLKKKVKPRMVEDRFMEVKQFWLRSSDGDHSNFAHLLSTVKMELMTRASSPKITTWLEYKQANDDIYERHPRTGRLFTTNEIIQTILGVVSLGTNSSTGYPLLLAAEDAQEINAIFPVCNDEEDRQQISNLLNGWKAWMWWRYPPVEELASTFGPSIALYFAFMALCARWLIFPSFIVSCSFVWHTFFSKYGISLGGAFNEGWSAACFSIILQFWASIFLAKWKCSLHDTMHRLGQLTSVQGEDMTLDNAKLHFRNSGYSLSGRSGVSLRRVRSTSQAKKETFFWKHFKLATAMFSLAALCSVVIALLCRFSDIVAKLNYFEDPLDWRNSLFQNMFSVIVYLIVAMPLQSIYDWIIGKVLRSEGHTSQSEYEERKVRRRALFQLLNYYCWFLYLGIWTEDWMALRAQLITFFVVKPSGLGGALMDVLIPTCRKVTTRKQFLHETVAEEWRKAAPEMFDEFMQVAVVFGAATCFAPVFPEGIIVAFLYTVLEYVGDKTSLVSKRLGLPRVSDVHTLLGWISVFDGLGWVAIAASTWLLYVFLKGMAKTAQITACPEGEVWPRNVSLPHVVTCANGTWDDYVIWDPIRHSSIFGTDIVNDILESLFPAGSRTVFILLILEHILVIMKGYISSSIPPDSAEAIQHQSLVEDCFQQYLSLPKSVDPVEIVEPVEQPIGDCFQQVAEREEHPVGDILS